MFLVISETISISWKGSRSFLRLAYDDNDVPKLFQEGCRRSLVVNFERMQGKEEVQECNHRILARSFGMLRGSHLGFLAGSRLIYIVHQVSTLTVPLLCQKPSRFSTAFQIGNQNAKSITLSRVGDKFIELLLYLQILNKI